MEEKAQKEAAKLQKASQPASRKTDSMMDRFTKNLMSQVGREVGRVVTRGIMGMLKENKMRNWEGNFQFLSRQSSCQMPQNSLK